MAELRKCPAGHEYWFPGQRWHHQDCVSVVNRDVVNEASNTVVNSRQVEWQRKNRDKYNEKMRDYMKSYRARKRAG